MFSILGSVHTYVIVYINNGYHNALPDALYYRLTDPIDLHWVFSCCDRKNSSTCSTIRTAKSARDVDRGSEWPDGSVNIPRGLMSGTSPIISTIQLPVIKLSYSFLCPMLVFMNYISQLVAEWDYSRQMLFPLHNFRRLLMEMSHIQDAYKMRSRIKTETDVHGAVLSTLSIVLIMQI